MADEAIPAATLILVRDSPGGRPELLMVERAQAMAFAAGAWVFPGGRIDPADRVLATRLGRDCAAVAAMIAAIRETLEETAVPAALTPTPTADDARQMQAKLATSADFAAILDGAGLAIDWSALTLFARWVPEFHAVRRFDTLFYVARCPAGDWQPQIIAGECAGAAWVGAADLLQSERDGRARLIFPTRRTLERLARCSSFEDIRADALAHAVRAITPWVEERDGEKFITIPDDLGFPVTAEKLDGLWRG
ncbi:MAG: NUDIX domain-containing protein [Sphingomicrobium sp.]